MGAVLRHEWHEHGPRDQPLPLLTWRLPVGARAVASGPYGGGLGARSWLLNAQVPHGYDRRDPHEHLDELRRALGLDAAGVGMLTAADLDGLCRAEEGPAGGRVEVAATVGISTPTWAAAPSGQPAAAAAGTINVVCWVPEPLDDAALVNAVITATEAKSQALAEAGVSGTGTPTDAVVVACPSVGEAHRYGGPRSTWGARLARAVHRAIAAGSTPQGDVGASSE